MKPLVDPSLPNPSLAAEPRTQRERLASLGSYRVLDTPAEASFDDLTKLAAMICGTPIALVSLVDAGRQWFKSEFGLGIREMPIETSICAHGILEPRFMEVPDTLNDPRTAGNPLVMADDAVRFYAGTPLISNDGHALGMFCVLDKKPRRLTDEQREALSALGRQAMIQLELRKVIASQDAIMRVRSELLEIAGHDLRQPLQVLSMSVDILRRAAPNANPNIADRARRAIDILDTELKELALRSRREDSEFFAIAETDIGALVERTIATWEIHARHRNLRLRARTAPIIVSTDARLLSTMLGNLVGNAIKYTSRGGVLVACRRKGEWVVIDVVDTGAGIPDDKLSEIFEPFTQLDTARDGLGLGLSIIRQTSALIGAKLSVRSRVGRGSRFSIAIPVSLAVTVPD